MDGLTRRLAKSVALRGRDRVPAILSALLLSLLAAMPGCGGGGGGGDAVLGDTFEIDANALLTGDQIAALSTENPAGIEAPVDVDGLNAGDTLVSIDRRPVNGFLYGIGFNAIAGTVQLYAVSSATGQATAVGPPPGNFTAPVSGPQFGMDFNPTVDRIRLVTSSGLNFRMNPNNGALVDADPGTAGNQPDGAIKGATMTVQGAAYTNNALNATVTTLYTLDQVSDAMYIQNPPNDGTQTVQVALSSMVDAILGFDIPAGVNVAVNNAQASGSGFAFLTLTGQAGQFFSRVNLTTGALTQTTAVSAAGIVGLAVQNINAIPMVALTSGGGALVRFSSTSPGTTVTVAVSGVAAGEILVGIDFRPQTGQLYGLGVNEAADTATLYLIDPQVGTATPVGATGGIALTNDGVTPVDLPLPTAGWGFDFNPTVDRIRVVTNTGLNFRINPNNGVPVDANAGIAGAQPDGAINGLTLGSTGLTGVAYTNNFGQSLTGGVTTLYAIDSTANGLHILNPPNNGTVTPVVPITSGVAQLNFDAVSGFDISSDVRVVTNNAVASGLAFAALTVSGQTNLYSIDLATGAATNLGPIGSGLITLGGLAVGQRTVN